MPEWLSIGERIFLGTIVGAAIFMFWKVYKLAKDE